VALIVIGAVVALGWGIRWRVVGVAFLATLPIVVVSWRYELRDSQYLPRRRGWSEPVAVPAIVSAAVCVAVVVAVVVPNGRVAARFYGSPEGPDAPRYQAMSAAAGWLASHAVTGTRIGFDDEPARQVYVELDGRLPMAMVPQAFVRPAEDSTRPLSTIAWVDVGRLGTAAPELSAPLVRLATIGDGRYFVGLEGRRFTDWLVEERLAYLIVTRQQSFGLGSMREYLDRQPGLRLAFTAPGPYELWIYAVRPEAVSEVEHPLYVDPTTLEAFERATVGRDGPAAVARLNPAGLRIVPEGLP
jgi:hypothetical protein